MTKGLNKKTPKIIVVVLGLAVNSKGQFLLTLRNDPTNPRAHNKWEIAGGGMEFGESPETTCVRELQEEIGVTPEIIYPNPIVVTNTWTNKYQVVLLTYLVDIGGQEIKLDMDETVDYAWYNLHDALNLDYLPALDKILIAADKLLRENPDLGKRIS